MRIASFLKTSKVYLGIFLISSSILMMELILTRIFSVKLYYHYAFMVISLALFGSGASGVYIYLFPNFFKCERLARHLRLFSICFAISIPLVLYLILEWDFELLFSPWLAGHILLLYTIPAIPFFLGGLCVSLAMTHLAQNVNRLYFFDLAGAAFGCLLVIPLLNWLGGPNAMLAISLVAILACWLFTSGVAGRLRWFPLLLFLLASGTLAYAIRHPFLTIKHVKGRNEAPPLYSKWNSFSRITVVQVNDDPNNTWIIMDGDAGTPLPNFNGDLREWSYLKNTVSSLAYHLKKDAHTLIIGPGGGIDMLTSLVFENRDIKGVEINPIIVDDVMRGAFKTFTGGLYERPEINIVVDEGRSFIRKENKQYDIIQATLVDTWAATAAGAFSLTENNLYTVEAFKDYFSKLKPDGILSITRWNLDPPQEDLRLVSITRSAMHEMGMLSPERCMMVVRKNKDEEAVECNLLFKKSGFSDKEIQKIEEISKQNSFDILYTPHTILENPFAKLITTPDPQQFYASYPFNVSPTRDNSPFFFHTVRLRDLRRSLYLAWESKKTNVGVLVLFMVFLIALVLVLIFIFVPLYLTQRQAFKKNSQIRLRGLSYFICLGLGFILVEMTLVQKFILFLGPPVYALSVVFFSMLLFSGFGSFFSSRLAGANLKRNLRYVCILVSALVLTYLGVLPFFLYSYVGLAIYWKALLAFGLLFPLSFMMGMPMPLGIHWLRQHSPEMIPWAWGVNGSASVLGSIMTILIAVNFGFDQALCLAAVLYAVGVVAVSAGEEKMTDQDAEVAIAAHARSF